jgi:hypothetical protein
MRLVAALIAGVLALAALEGPAAAQPSEAERLYLEGQRAYDGRRYDIALALWQRSFELSKLPELLFNIAQAHRLRNEPGDCAKAVELYRELIERCPSAPRRPTAESFLRELRGCAPPPPPPPDPPPSAQSAQSAQSAPVGPAAPPGASPPMPPHRDRGGGGTGSGKRVLGAIAASGGAALALAGVYFSAKARRLGDEVSDACAGGCTWEDVAAKDAAGRSAERTQWILYGAGAGVVIAGAAIYYLGVRARAPAMAVAPRAGGALLAWSGRW